MYLLFILSPWKSLTSFSCDARGLKRLVYPVGFEPTTLRLEGGRSVQLSYGYITFASVPEGTFGARDGNRTRITGLQDRGSAIELLLHV